MFVLMFQASFVTNRCSEKEAMAPLSPFLPPPPTKKDLDANESRKICFVSFSQSDSFLL